MPLQPRIAQDDVVFQASYICRQGLNVLIYVEVLDDHEVGKGICLFVIAERQPASAWQSSQGKTYIFRKRLVDET